jgi:chaperonin GroES
MTIRPFSDNVVLRRQDPEKVSKGGIIIADQAQEKSLRCEVVAVGPGRVSDQGVRIVPEMRKGDMVLVASKYAGNEVELEDGKKYLVVRATEIAGVIEPTSTL